MNYFNDNLEMKIVNIGDGKWGVFTFRSSSLATP
jgi:hypothetical protein